MVTWACRSLQLLRQWLSPAQRARLAESGYFEVVGCDTGTQYRIYPGAMSNVCEIDEKGRPRIGLCFRIVGELQRREHRQSAVRARKHLKDKILWRSEIDALVFSTKEHAALCAVHRRAFRTLLESDPTPEGCLNYFGLFEDAFRAAASSKIVRQGLPTRQNFHLTSRDVARKLVELEPREHGEE